MDARPVVTDADFHTVGKTSGGSQERRLEAIPRLAGAPGRRVKPVGDHVEQRPRDLLRVQLDLAGSGVEIAFERDLEIGAFGTRTVIGQIEALLDEGVDVDGSALASFPRANAAACS